MMVTPGQRDKWRRESIEHMNQFGAYAGTTHDHIVRLCDALEDAEGEIGRAHERANVWRERYTELVNQRSIRDGEESKSEGNASSS